MIILRKVSVYPSFASVFGFNQRFFYNYGWWKLMTKTVKNWVISRSKLILFMDGLSENCEKMKLFVCGRFCLTNYHEIESIFFAEKCYVSIWIKFVEIFMSVLNIKL